MYVRKERRKQIILAILIIICVFFLTLHYRGGQEGFLVQARRAVMTVISPLQLAVTTVVSPFRNSIQYLGEIRDLKVKNTRLERQVKRLEHQVISLRKKGKENDRLRKLAGFKKDSGFKTKAASVIGRSITGWEALIVIDKGSAAGITKNMPVVAGYGLVGQVVDVSPYASQVQLIIDQRSGVAAELLESGKEGILEGQIDGKLKLGYISKESEVKRGDIVLTSGLGGVFPKGIEVGKVSKVEEDPYDLYKKIEVRPEADFSSLEEVLVIVNPSPPSPYQPS